MARSQGTNTDSTSTPDKPTTLHDDDSSKQGAAKSTGTASTATSSTSSTSPQSPYQSRQVIIKTANKNQADARSYDYLADGKYKTTKAWDTVTDRNKKQNKPFTHLEGILERLIANPRLKPDMSTIQDGISIKFAPAAQFHFNKPWNSPDVSIDMLTKFARDLIDLNSSIPWANKAMGQDARNTLIKLAQTSPKIFDEAWAYSTGFIPNCKEGTLWAMANRIYGSHWVFLQPQLLPKLPKKSTKKEKRQTSCPHPYLSDHQRY
jgi:hypothetical protein